MHQQLSASNPCCARRFEFFRADYLRAASGQLPELKRVIAAYGDRVVMEETLGEALAALFKEAAPVTSSSKGTADARASEALAHYERAVERLKAGDWAGFGAELDALGPLLKALGAGPGENQK
jgi:uncharacterized protein